MNLEKNTRICKACLKPHLRILAGKWGESKDKKWVDENGMTWNGNTCGWCNKLRVRNHMGQLDKKRRAEKYASEQPNLPKNDNSEE